MPQQTKEAIAIDLRRWQGVPIAEVRSQNASFPIEAGDRPFEERITVLAVPLESFAKLKKSESLAADDIATTKICDWAKQTKASIEIWTNSSTQEEILEAMRDFIEINPGQAMIWISPKEKGIYLETRIGIYQVVSVNSKKHLFFRTLCSNHSFENCQKMALGFKKDIVFEDPEALRATPIPVIVPRDNPIDFFSSIIKMPSVFEAIRKGADIKNNLLSLEQASKIITKEVYQRIQTATSFSQQIMLGQFIERQLQERSGTRLLNGTCGILYSSLTAPSLTQIFGHSSITTAEGGRRKHCGKCGKHGYFTEGESCSYDQSSKN